MSKDKDERLKEKEKLDAEIARSLSVVKMKAAHKQIEDIEKLRKQSAIKSIIQRLELVSTEIGVINDSILSVKKEKPEMKLDFKLTETDAMKQMIDT